MAVRYSIRIACALLLLGGLAGCGAGSAPKPAAASLPRAGERAVSTSPAQPSPLPPCHNIGPERAPARQRMVLATKAWRASPTDADAQDNWVRAAHEYGGRLGRYTAAAFCERTTPDMTPSQVEDYAGFQDLETCLDPTLGGPHLSLCHGGSLPADIDPGTATFANAR